MPSRRKPWGRADVALDPSFPAIAGRHRRARSVAIARQRADFWPRLAAAVLLLQSGRCIQPDHPVVFEWRDLETSGHHAVGVDPGVRDRLPPWRHGLALVLLPAP